MACLPSSVTARRSRDRWPKGRGTPVHQARVRRIATAVGAWKGRFRARESRQRTWPRQLALAQWRPPRWVRPCLRNAQCMVTKRSSQRGGWRCHMLPLRQRNFCSLRLVGHSPTPQPLKVCHDLQLAGQRAFRPARSGVTFRAAALRRPAARQQRAAGWCCALWSRACMVEQTDTAGGSAARLLRGNLLLARMQRCSNTPGPARPPQHAVPLLCSQSRHGRWSRSGPTPSGLRRCALASPQRRSAQASAAAFAKPPPALRGQNP